VRPAEARAGPRFILWRLRTHRAYEKLRSLKILPLEGMEKFLGICGGSLVRSRACANDIARSRALVHNPRCDSLIRYLNLRVSATTRGIYGERCFSDSSYENSMYFPAKRRRLIFMMRRLRRSSILYKYNIIFAKLCKFHFVRACSKNDAYIEDIKDTKTRKI